MHKTSEWLISHSSDSTESKKNRKAQTISITGGKGGVGKTSISLKLSQELAHLGNRVLLIDCDYNLSNTAIKLGLPLNNKFYSLISSHRSFDDCLYKDGNFHLLSASNGDEELFDSGLKLEQFIIDIISEHEHEYDYIILDSPAGLQKDNLTLNAYCTKRIMVVNPDRSSITDSYSLIKLLHTRYGIKDNHLIVNKYENKSQYKQVVKTLSETVENFLGARTIFLGGIKQIEANGKNFDDEFLSRGKNLHHANFLKVVKKLTDEKGTPEKEVSALYAPSEGLVEQEVH